MLYSTFQQIWKPQHCHMELQNVSLHSNPKEWQSKECSNYCTIVLISNASTFMLKILQTRLQQCVNWESADVQTGFRKGRVIRDQIANIHWVMENVRELRKISTSVSLTTLNPTTLWITTNWKILKEMGVPNHFICLLRNLYAGQETTDKTRHGTTNWFKIGRVWQGCKLPPCLFNLYTEYIIGNAGLDESQAGIKTAERNINSLRYAMIPL